MKKSRYVHGGNYWKRGIYSREVKKKKSIRKAHQNTLAQRIEKGVLKPGQRSLVAIYTGKVRTGNHKKEYRSLVDLCGNLPSSKKRAGERHNGNKALQQPSNWETKRTHSLPGTSLTYNIMV